MIRINNYDSLLGALQFYQLIMALQHNLGLGLVPLFQLVHVFGMRLLAWSLYHLAVSPRYSFAFLIAISFSRGLDWQRS